ncbi:MAG: ATP-binding protein [Prevotella sp.]|nr:ATP-binding protein [Prevotella sp.]
MRYLNKIIFINSAHVPYAEIKLDGNVHFIGTQGVGKSTLLRAILFFYNVDKSKLGIKTQAGQKGYDEFYLPHQNSYIIYEVCRETGKFFVMTFLSHGRTAFRIVDCAYDKRFFVDEDGNARYEWGRISEQIGTRVYKSNIIRGYEEFRDIIYGNSQQVAKDLRRFSLMESTKYRQVPLTIQNIFLNQSLESRVIKDTIIDSMDFASDDIDLNRYREEVKNFRQQYEDIWKWYKVEKNGKVKVKTEADAVIERYTHYEYVRKLIAELCGQLNYALDRDTHRLPVLAEQESVRSTELSRQRRLLGEEETKYKAEEARLNQEEGAIKFFLEQVKSKRQHYTEIGIEQIAKHVSKEGELNIQQQSLTHQEETLTSKNQSVKSKYDTLAQEVDNHLSAFGLQCQKQLNELDRQRIEAEGRLQAESNEKAETIRNQYEQKLKENQNSLDEARQTKNELKLQEQRIKQSNPYKEEMDEQDRKIKGWGDKLLVLYKDSTEKQKEIDHIINDVAMQRKEMETACEKEVSAIENDIRLVSADIAKLDDMLSRQKGSLMEWLSLNKPGWEDNIGKVLDEDAVLYNSSLNPQMSASSSDSIYGVKIDADNIEKTVKTPDEVKTQKAVSEQKVEELNKRIALRKHQLETDIAELERKPHIQLKQLRLDKMTIDAEYNQIPHRIELLTKEKTATEEHLKKWREDELEKLQKKLGAIGKEIETLDKQKDVLTAQRDKEIASLQSSYNKQKKELKSNCDQQKAAVNAELKHKEQAAIQRKAELLAQMDAELKGLGVDVDQLADIRRQLQKVTEDLKYIDEHRADFISWQNDIRDYFDHEQQKKEERKQVRQKMDDLQDKFLKRKQQYDEKIKHLSDEVSALRKEQEKLTEAISKVQAFMSNPSCPSDIDAAGEMETVKPLADILEELRDQIASQQRKFEDFKEAVIRFKSNFSPQNTFFFRTEFNTDADYTEFAAELNEFISNNKIEQYRVRTSRQYATIIKRIAKDVSDLSQHKSDIERTILDINRDFRENNFAGVIKDIELRAVESNDRLMQQLLNIKHFDDEHGFDIGQLNLFTDEDNLNRTNEQAVRILMTLIEMMDAEQKREQITLADTFKLEFKVKENDNDTNWVEKLSNVGSDGTDILVKAMVNIMLINVFKRKISRKFGDFKLHCMMDEIGKLHPNNVEGILKFANVRNINLINSSPTTYNAQAYKYTYSLSKDDKSNTVVKTLLTIR